MSRAGAAFFEFLYNGENNYIVKKTDGTVLLCLKAYGLKSLVVNKYATTMMTKSVAEEDRFDLIGDRWVATIGPSKVHVANMYNEVFNRISTHYEREIARMITE